MNRKLLLIICAFFCSTTALTMALENASVALTAHENAIFKQLMQTNANPDKLFSIVTTSDRAEEYIDILSKRITILQEEIDMQKTTSLLSSAKSSLPYWLTGAFAASLTHVKGTIKDKTGGYQINKTLPLTLVILGLGLGAVVSAIGLYKLYQYSTYTSSREKEIITLNAIISALITLKITLDPELMDQE